MKKLIPVFIFSLYFWGHTVAHAHLIINEVMYDLEGSDEGKEWVEIYNHGSASFDLSEYKFLEAGVNHKLVSVAGSAKLEGSEYAVLVSNLDKFKKNYPNFSGNIFDSSFTLSNTGESIALTDKNLNVVDEVSYSSSMGGSANGRTLAKIGDAWMEGKPTLGLANEVYVAPVFVSNLASNKKTSPVEARVVVQKKAVEVKNIEEKTTAEHHMPMRAVASVEESEILNNSGNSYIPILASFG